MICKRRCDIKRVNILLRFIYDGSDIPLPSHYYVLVSKCPDNTDSSQTPACGGLLPETMTFAIPNRMNQETCQVNIYTKFIAKRMFIYIKDRRRKCVCVRGGGGYLPSNYSEWVTSWEDEREMKRERGGGETDIVGIRPFCPPLPQGRAHLYKIVI